MMDPLVTGKKYDAFAQLWHNQHENSHYGLSQVEKAVSYCENKGDMLDVGCGCGGRIIKSVQREGFDVHGIDVSAGMIALAKRLHPDVVFEHGNICTWSSTKKFDLIVAWDSIFHLPLDMQEPVITKLCKLLNKSGIFIYTFGDAIGEHESVWNDEVFYYSSIGINENLRILMKNGCEVKHLELDQYPFKHVYAIVKKL